MRVFNQNITTDEMLEQYDYDIDKTKKYFDWKITYQNYLNITKPENPPVFGVLLEELGKENEINKKMADFKKAIEEKDKIVKNYLETELAQRNKDNKNTPNYINVTEDDINRLCQNKKDVDILTKIIAKLQTYNEKMNSSYNIKNIEQLCENKRNYDWTTVYLKIIFFPLIMDYNAIASRSKVGLKQKNLNDILKEYDDDLSNINDQEKPWENIEKVANTFQEEINKCRNTHLKHMLKKLMMLFKMSMKNLN